MRAGAGAGARGRPRAPARARARARARRRAPVGLVLALALLAPATPSLADDAVPAGPAGSPAPPGIAVSGDGPPSLLDDPLVLARNAVVAAVALETVLTTRSYVEPSSVAPDVWVGATDRLTVGVVHSARATGTLGAGLGLCFTGTAHGCPRAYDNVGLDARYRLRDGWLAAAARARLVASSFDPFKPSLRVGGLGRLHRGRLAVIADPHVQIGLANRDQGNRDWVRVPIWLAVEPIVGRWTVALRTGVEGEVEVFDEAYAIPLGIDTTVRITRRYDVSLLAALPYIGGPLNQYRTRVVWLAVTGRWP